MTNQPIDPLPSAVPPSAVPAAAWYDDPDDPTGFRYWDGAAWTDHRSPKHAAQPAASEVSGWPLLRLIAAGAAIAIMIGSVTTWASVSASFMSVDISGTDGDGSYTLFGGIAVFGLVFVRKYLGAIIVGLVTGGILISDLVDVASLVDDEFATVSVGWGLYLAAAGAVAAVVSLIALKIGERSQQPSPD